MIRSAAIQVGNIIKSMKIGFDDTNLYILDSIPEKVLQNRHFPIIRIDGLPTTENIYAGNHKQYETVSCQVNLWAEKNKDIEKYQNLIEKNVDTHQFECFFDDQDFDDEYKIHRLVLKFLKVQKIKELL